MTSTRRNATPPVAMPELVDECKADSRCLCLVPAYGCIELGDCFWMLPLGQGHVVREARKRA